MAGIPISFHRQSNSLRQDPQTVDTPHIQSPFPGRKTRHLLGPKPLQRKGPPLLPPSEQPWNRFPSTAPAAAAHVCHRLRSRRGVPGGNGQGLDPPDSSRGRGATNHRTGRPLIFPGFGGLAAAADQVAGLYLGGSSGRPGGGIPAAAATSGGESHLLSPAGCVRGVGGCCEFLEAPFGYPMSSGNRLFDSG